MMCIIILILCIVYNNINIVNFPSTNTLVEFCQESIGPVRCSLGTSDTKRDILVGPLKIPAYCHFQRTCKDFPLLTNKRQRYLLLTQDHMLCTK